MDELNAPIVRPGISAATLAKLDIRHIDEAEASRLLGQKFAGLYIPYNVHVDGKLFGRLRLDKPESDRKYTQRAGSGVHPYFPELPGQEAQPDLVIVEGEFKAIALCEGGRARHWHQRVLRISARGRAVPASRPTSRETSAAAHPVPRRQ